MSANRRSTSREHRREQRFALSGDLLGVEERDRSVQDRDLLGHPQLRRRERHRAEVVGRLVRPREEDRGEARVGIQALEVGDRGLGLQLVELHRVVPLLAVVYGPHVAGAVLLHRLGHPEGRDAEPGAKLEDVLGLLVLRHAWVDFIRPGSDAAFQVY